MRFVDLDGRRVSPEALDDTSYGVAWANDNATVFYVRVDEAMRPYQLWRHRVGTDPGGDTLVYEETDDHFYLGVGGPRTTATSCSGCDSKVTSECRALAGRRTRGRVPGSSSPGARASSTASTTTAATPPPVGPSRFLIVTNDGAEDFRLMEAPDDVPGPGAPGAR